MRNTVRQRVLVVVLLALLLPTMSPVAAATPVPSYYTLTELGTLPGATEAAALAINDRGQTVGYVGIDRTRYVGYLYDNGQTQDLSAFGLNLAYGINNNGQIVGGSALLSGGTTTSLLPAQDGTDFFALALNDNAQIVGDSDPNRPANSQPLLWQQGTITSLLPGRHGRATDINNAGQLAVTENIAFDQYGAVRRSVAYRFDLATGQLTDLQAQIGSTDPIIKSGASGINEAGHIVGFASTGQRSLPVLWRDGQAIDLGGFGAASGINDSDQIVGSSSNGRGLQAALWRDGQRFDLNALIPQGTDWQLTQALAINNAGQIVGIGTRADLRLRAFLLTPRFRDLPPGHPSRDAILALADRGIIQGYGDGRVGADDPVLRAQSAGLIARAGGWDTEDWPDTTFPDQGAVDDVLWRTVRTLAHYRVALGYKDGTYDPTGEVLHQQVVLFIARALIAKGYWVEQSDTNPYPNLPNTTDREQADRRAVATYVHYAGAVPDRPVGQSWADWDRSATRGWFAQALWQALQTVPSPASTR